MYGGGNDNIDDARTHRCLIVATRPVPVGNDIVTGGKEIHNQSTKWQEGESETGGSEHTSINTRVCD